MSKITDLPVELYHQIFESMSLNDLYLLYDDNSKNNFLRESLISYFGESYDLLKKIKVYPLFDNILNGNDIKNIKDFNSALDIIRNKYKCNFETDNIYTEIKNKNYKLTYRNNEKIKETINTNSKLSLVIHYINGNKREEIWYKDNKISRDDKPAHIKYNYNGLIVSEVVWYKDGRITRDNGPAVTNYNDDGNKIEERWYKDGRITRDNEPAIVNYNNDGNKIEERWYKDGIKTRDDGPSIIYYDKYGKIYFEEWYKDNVLSRDDGPAIINKKSNKLVEELWYKNGDKIKLCTTYLK